MFESPFILVDKDGAIKDVNDAASLLCGLPRDELRGGQLANCILADHRLRLGSELEALVAGEEQHGRIYCTIVGLDGIGRRLVMRMVRSGDADVLITLAPDRSMNFATQNHVSSLFDSGRMLPVARRITAISRRADSKEELLRRGLEIVAEVISSATAGAALEWRSTESALHVVAEVGSFDHGCIPGILRPAVIARLTRGDVVVKEPDDDGDDSSDTLLLVPLLSHEAPVGLIALFIEGHSVLAPEEQQRLAIIGEILGLGLRGIAANTAQERGAAPHRGDAEANVALGRLSAGLAHEINNAATILRSNIEQLMLRRAGSFRDGSLSGSAFRDCVIAIEEIRDLTEGLRAFAPEETRGLEEVDPLRILDMVVRSVRFYAKHGLGVTYEPPTHMLPQVQVRSHHLIRSLFLIFEELMETGLDRGNDIKVHIDITERAEQVIIGIRIITAPLPFPSVLLAQLEKGGALARQLLRAEAEITHVFDDAGNLSMSLCLPSAATQRRSSIPTSRPSPTRRGTVLIADDEVAVIRSLRRVLEADHDVLAAQSGREALGIIRSHPQIDIILCDVYLAHVDGIELFKELKRQGHPLAERLIFATGGALNPEASNFLTSIDNYVLEKPLDTQLLKDTIASLL